MIFMNSLFLNIVNVSSTANFLNLTNQNADVFVLLADLDFSNVSQFVPQVFNSTFNGNGHTMKNIFINTPTTSALPSTSGSSENSARM